VAPCLQEAPPLSPPKPSIGCSNKATCGSFPIHWPLSQSMLDSKHIHTLQVLGGRQSIKAHNLQRKKRRQRPINGPAGSLLSPSPLWPTDRRAVRQAGGQRDSSSGRPPTEGDNGQDAVGFVAVRPNCAVWAARSRGLWLPLVGRGLFGGRLSVAAMIASSSPPVCPSRHQRPIPAGLRSGFPLESRTVVLTRSNLRSTPFLSTPHDAPHRSTGPCLSPHFFGAKHGVRLR
jgi:hypothetical protein